MITDLISGTYILQIVKGNQMKTDKIIIH
ncbi:MAG: hypothetical protein ACPG21_13615 [Crocinitomicaceae bacterium]